VPTIPALARARRFLDQQERPDVTLIITGGHRTPADFVKALSLGADGIAVSNSAMQATLVVWRHASVTATIVRPVLPHRSPS